jgi:DUF1680 family protein
MKDQPMKSSSPFRRLTPVPFRHVAVKDAFWAPRIETNRRVTLPAEYRQLGKVGHIGAWSWTPGKPKAPHIFWDSDLAKWIEAAACSLATRPDRKLQRQVDDAVDCMARAQDADGYLNSHFLRVEPEKRWSNLRDAHELYCAGHLLEAAVAYFDATGKRKFLDVMCCYADYIGRVFGPKKGQKRGYCGHPEIELALVRLARATGENRYLMLAKYFVDERGRAPNYFAKEALKRGDKKPYDLSILQAHIPVRRQTEATGHAVRAAYLYSAMADVAMDTGDAELLETCRRLWRSIEERRLYVIGGIGSTRFHEQFTFDHDLPNEEAYAETCANIALVFFAHRMLQAEPDRRYADVMERALYNGVLSGVARDGKRFFYDNVLACKPESNAFSGRKPPGRQEWFGCACCPPNISRLLASLGQYVYSQSDRELFVHLFVAGQAEVKMAGQKIRIEQRTNYPWDGRVTLAIDPATPAVFTLAVRMPGWCRRARFTVNGKPVRTDAGRHKGYVKICREWQKGDQVRLDLAMPIERLEAHPAVRQDAGRLALQRGPIVYAVEEIDNGKDLADLVLPRGAKLSTRFERGLLGGVVTIRGQARRRDTAGWKGQLYRPVGLSRLRAVPFQAVPYAFWANRGIGEMIVWIRSL